MSSLIYLDVQELLPVVCNALPPSNTPPSFASNCYVSPLSRKENQHTMFKHVANFAVLGALVAGCLQVEAAGAHVLLLPRRSQLTPVQRLNREGVDAVNHHNYDKAEQLFYKAYLYDPSDPFTLNNLGYVSEIQGQLDRARKFYDLAAEQGSDAVIDRSSDRHLEGEPMKTALVDLKDVPMHVNRMNLDAMRLVSQNRGFEAVALLRGALSLQPRNPFTLNNLGVASEAIGDFDSALRYYTQAANTHSKEPAVVTLDRTWRGKSVSSMASESAKRLRRKMRDMDPAQSKALMYTLRGVYAENQNDWAAAREAFTHAYALDPQDAFVLNNRGYVAEREGDLETAQFFYEKARRAQDSNARVGLATQLAAQGQPLGTVATDSNSKVDTALDIYARQRRQQGAPVELTPRGPGAEPQNQPAPNTPTTPNSPQQ